MHVSTQGKIFHGSGFVIHQCQNGFWSGIQLQNKQFYYFGFWLEMMVWRVEAHVSFPSKILKLFWYANVMNTFVYKLVQNLNLRNVRITEIAVVIHKCTFLQKHNSFVRNLRISCLLIKALVSNFKRHFMTCRYLSRSLQANIIVIKHCF